MGHKPSKVNTHLENTGTCVKTGEFVSSPRGKDLRRTFSKKLIEVTEIIKNTGDYNGKSEYSYTVSWSGDDIQCGEYVILAT